MRSAGIDLELVPAAELDLFRALEASDEELRLASYGNAGTTSCSRRLTARSPQSSKSRSSSSLCAASASSSLTRSEIQPSRAIEADWPSCRRGVLLQVTAASLLPGRRRSRTTELARALVSDGLAHVSAVRCTRSGRRASGAAQRRRGGGPLDRRGVCGLDGGGGAARDPVRGRTARTTLTPAFAGSPPPPTTDPAVSPALSRA